MKSTIKQIIMAFVFIIAISSCIPERLETEVRTPAMEQSEIDQLLKQIEDAGLNVDTTGLGVFYIIDTLGPGPLPKFGDTLFMKYTGYFLDGYVFDDSDYHQENEGGVWEFIFEQGGLISGFENGIGLMSKGTKLNMIIPSSLAYGENGTSSILPYSPLRFEAEMVNIKYRILE